MYRIIPFIEAYQGAYVRTCILISLISTVFKATLVTEYSPLRKPGSFPAQMFTSLGSSATVNVP